MQAEMQAVSVTDNQGNVVDAKRLEKTDRVHRQLRPQFSGVQRQEVHRFYFRGRMAVSSFCFKKAVK